MGCPSQSLLLKPSISSHSIRTYTNLNIHLLSYLFHGGSIVMCHCSSQVYSMAGHQANHSGYPGRHTNVAASSILTYSSTREPSVPPHLFLTGRPELGAGCCDRGRAWINSELQHTSSCSASANPLHHSPHQT